MTGAEAFELLVRRNPVGAAAHAELAVRAEMLRLQVQIACQTDEGGPSSPRAPAAQPTARRRRLYLVVALSLLLVAVAAPALAFRGQIVDFLTAKHAPKVVVRQFGQLQVVSLPQVHLRVFPAQARRVTSVRLDRHRIVLYVAPARGGGFCTLWLGYVGPECVPTRSAHGGVASFSYGAAQPDQGVDSVAGAITRPDATVRLQFADGDSVQVPYVWVTAPINAGFFLYEVPSGRRLGSKRPTALFVSSGNRQLTRIAIRDVTRDTRLVNHTDRWGQTVRTTAESVWSRRKRLYSFNASDGRLITLYVMPSRESRTRVCFTSPTTTGCESEELTGSPVQLQLTGTRTGAVLLWGRVSRRVATIELRFQDQAALRVIPRRTFVLIEVPATRYRSGHRLVRANVYDRAGHLVGGSTFDPTLPDVYPCTNPRQYGYGTTRCP